ncbi:MAG: E3 binding domain-containing protein, partial [Acidobacteria bacterium]|nr:E3 binding domain-containing protein [Acidobacteriota bacterium]
MKPIITPQVGQDIPDAVISRWLKNENDRVERGEAVLVLESDKASFEIEAECSGVLANVLHQGGDRVEVLQPLAYIAEAEEAVQESASAGNAGILAAIGERASPCPPGTTPEDPGKTPADRSPAQRPPSRHASASARHPARELGGDLSRVQGTGPGGRVVPVPGGIGVREMMTLD